MPDGMIAIRGSVVATGGMMKGRDGLMDALLNDPPPFPPPRAGEGRVGARLMVIAPLATACRRSRHFRVPDFQLPYFLQDRRLSVCPFCPRPPPRCYHRAPCRPPRPPRHHPPPPPRPYTACPPRPPQPGPPAPSTPLLRHLL